MRISSLINRSLHKWMIRYVQNTYRRGIRARQRQFPDLFPKVSDALIKEHSRLWGKFGYRVDDHWLRQQVYLSGKSNPWFCPEDLYYTVVERCLNDCNANGCGVENKIDISFYIPVELQPKTILRYMRGVFFDEGMFPITAGKADEVLRTYEGNLIGKTAVDSSGGKGVKLFYASGRHTKKTSSGVSLSASWIAENETAYVVQEQVKQEPQSRAYHPSSLNTCRMMTFRRPWNGKVSVIGAMLRIGGGTSFVDNLSSGGVSIGIGSDGVLAPFATDYFLRKYQTHPVSGIRLGDKKMPFYFEMATAVCNCAIKIPGFNLLGFDVVMREDGRPCIIEINAKSLACQELQMLGPLFGDETEKVVDWCVDHQKFDHFDHFRTFY